MAIHEDAGNTFGNTGEDGSALIRAGERERKGYRTGQDKPMVMFGTKWLGKRGEGDAGIERVN
jgi:hypothetical protein